MSKFIAPNRKKEIEDRISGMTSLFFVVSCVIYGLLMNGTEIVGTSTDAKLEPQLEQLKKNNMTGLAMITALGVFLFFHALMSTFRVYNGIIWILGRLFAEMIMI